MVIEYMPIGSFLSVYWPFSSAVTVRVMPFSLCFTVIVAPAALILLVVLIVPLTTPLNESFAIAGSVTVPSMQAIAAAVAFNRKLFLLLVVIMSPYSQSLVKYIVYNIFQVENAMLLKR